MQRAQWIRVLAAMLIYTVATLAAMTAGILRLEGFLLSFFGWCSAYLVFIYVAWYY